MEGGGSVYGEKQKRELENSKLLGEYRGKQVRSGRGEGSGK